jgi:transcriptional regulator with PAS, ATPase and Fis domain
MGVETLLAVVGRALTRPNSGPSLREAFEDALGQMLPLRSAQLRRGGQSGGLATPARGTGAPFSVDVPAGEPHMRGALEVMFDTNSPAGEWEVQTLQAAAQLGGLILEIERHRLQLARTMQPDAARRDGAAPLIGSTREMEALRSQIARVASTHFTVLIEGESGVGKELVARQIHELSPRRRGPFVAVNCAAIVETLVEAELFGIEDRTATGVRGRRGKFEHAEGGTLFLDEISDLSLSAQAKLLRAIQELAVERVGGHGAHRVDVRIVAATNRSLAGLVERRLFRPDLFYRLSGVDVNVPSLRERRADILELARYFLERHRTVRPLKLSLPAAEALGVYDWPGNVRELERLIERAVALAESDVIELDDLPLGVRGAYAEALVPSLKRNDTLRAWGARYVRLILDRCQGNKREACRVLDISYHTLVSYLRFSTGGAAAEASAPARSGDPDDAVVGDIVEEVV